MALLTVVTALPVVGGPTWAAVPPSAPGPFAWRLARAADIVRSSVA